MAAEPRRIALASFLPILAFLVLAMSGAHKPLHLDSMEFAAAASAAADTGKPVFYKSEWSPAETALWHPPLYVHLLAGWFKLFGAGEAQARSFGMLCALWQGVTVLWIVQTLFGGPIRSSIEPWFWAVFLLNPYTIQSAAVLDIDSTIYGPLLCLLLLSVLGLTWRDGERREDNPSRVEYVWIAVALAAALWAKLTTVILVIPFLGLLLVSRFGFWRAVRITTFVTAAGAGAFLITFFAYGALLELDVRYTFSFLLFSFKSRGSSGQPGLAARFLDFRKNLAAMAPFQVEWTGLLPWVACAGGTLAAGWAAFTRRSERALHYCLLLTLAGGTILYYCSHTQTFGLAPFKYTFVFWGLVLTAPLLLAASGPFFGSPPAAHTNAVRPRTRRQEQTRRVVFGLLAALFLATAWYGRYRLMDRQITQWWPSKWENLIPAALVLPALLFAGDMGRRWRPSARILLFSGLACWSGLGAGIAVYQTTVPYSTTYDYGLSGIEETAAFLRANTPPGEFFASMKDLGYLTRRRFYDNYPGLFGGPDAMRRFIQDATAGKTKFVVFTTQGQDRLFLNPALERWVRERCTLVASFGHYRVYAVNRG